MQQQPTAEHPVRSAADVVAAVAALGPGDHAAVDADGTLWDADMGDEVVRAAGADPLLCDQPIDAARYFAELAHDHELACAFSTDVALKAVPARLDAALTAIIERSIRPRRYLVEALRAAIQRGARVWIVSASPVRAIELAMAHIGLDVAGIIAARAAPDGQGPSLPLPVGAGKVAGWRRLELPVPALAVGDSDWDLPLLSFAHAGVRVPLGSSDPHFGSRVPDVLAASTGDAT